MPPTRKKSSKKTPAKKSAAKKVSGAARKPSTAPPKKVAKKPATEKKAATEKKTGSTCLKCRLKDGKHKPGCENGPCESCHTPKGEGHATACPFYNASQQRSVLVDGKDAIVMSGATGAPLTKKEQEEEARKKQLQLVRPSLEDMVKSLGKKHRDLSDAILEAKRASERKKALQDELNDMVDKITQEYGNGHSQTSLPLSASEADVTAKKVADAKALLEAQKANKKKVKLKKVKPPEPGSEPLAPTMADAVDETKTSDTTELPTPPVVEPPTEQPQEPRNPGPIEIDLPDEDESE